MRKLAFLCAFVLVAGAALAQEPPGQQPPGQQPPGQQPPMAGQQPAQPAKTGATKELAAQVVSTDPVGKTITIKKDSGYAGSTGASGETTLPVEADAVSALKTVMPGEKVKLTCRTDSGGKETAVTAIRKDDKPKTNPLEKP
jgi:uncharacterized protein YdeI (BOF family)